MLQHPPLKSVKHQPHSCFAKAQLAVKQSFNSCNIYSVGTQAYTAVLHSTFFLIDSKQNFFQVC